MKSKIIFVLIAFLFVSGLSVVSAYSNPSNNWQANQPTFQNLYSGDMGNFWPILTQMKNDQCTATSDFVIGIPPGGCTPEVVRSDLLEEQNVPVFCKLYAIKVNPLIKVSSIKSISFSGKYPKGVRGIVFHPARAAVRSYTTLLGDPTLNNIGYVVVILKQNKIEKNMSKWIAGNLTATIKYDANEAYGTGASDYFLPVMSDEKWSTNYAESSFWNGRGYLRASSIGNGDARIQILTSKNKIFRTLDLKEGETSSMSYLPGYYCKAGLKVRLDSLTVPEDKALLNVDGQTIWVRDNGKFLNGMCRVVDLNVKANNEGDISIYCNGVGETKTLSLSKGGVIFKENGKPETYHIGDNIGDKYLVYYDTFGSGQNSEDFVVLSNSNPTDNELKKLRTTISAGMHSAKNFSVFEAGLEKNNKLLVFHSGSGPGKYSFDKFNNKISELEYSAGNNKVSYIDKYFNSANKTVNDLISMYRSEPEGNGQTYGEDALYSQIELAGDIGKFRTKAALLDLFIKTYPSSKIIDHVRRERQMLNGADFSNSFINVYVGNKFHSISVVDFRSVDEGKKTVDLRIGGASHDGLIETNWIMLNDGTNLSVQEILPGKVVLYFNSKKRDVDSETISITEGDSAVFDGIRVYAKNIKVNEVAHVSLIPDVQHTTTKANFTFKIGIEKSAIQLSPEKTKEMLENINKSIAQWQNIVDRLGNVIKGLKGACFATSAILTIKNMVSGMDGASMARQRVMQKYRGICDTDYKQMSHTECYNKLSENISKDVSAMTLAYNAVNKRMEIARKNNVGDSGGLFGGKSVVDNEKYKESLRNEIGSDKIISVDIGGGVSVDVPVSKIDSVSQLREVMLCQQLGCDKINKEDRDKVLENVALGVQQSAERNAVAKRLSKYAGLGVDASSVVSYSNRNTVNSRWLGKLGKDFKLGGENKGKRAQVVISPNSGKFYLVILSAPAIGGAMGPQEVYSPNENNDGWSVVARPDWLNNMVFYPSVSGECSYPFKDGTASVSYYEYGNNKGLPAIVPFDLSGGWYAMVPNSAGTFLDNSPQGYTASADVNYFKICNVGPNHLMEKGKGDDLCQSFDINTAGAVKTFIPCPKMSATAVSTLYQKAREAIREASQQHGQKSINIFNQIMNVGKPMSQLNGFECQDFMSPSDCKLMFNVCDPVICPPSRCDLGGRMHVSDVIQTGVIGSLALCLPNAKEGIMIPICLSGVQAGLDAYLSILKSESSCLQQSLTTGEHVGICKEITSIYMCEFFWRQLSPVMDQLLPSLIANVVSPGQRVSGGGEYALVQNSWNTMRKSVSYFKSFYAKNAFKAFNIRSVEGVGGKFCNSFVGTSVPSSANVLNSLLKPESPTQFYAQFSESLFTEATVPSTSQYNVYFHIYAGKDEGVQYRVYLKNPPASSYYASNPTVPIKTGYIAKGASADETVDVTAPSGYKELCVVINAKEECGFKQVTTNFAMNYIKNKFTEDQANKDDITTEKECVSGSPSVLSMANLNVQSGAEEIAKPNIALRGIVRVCASNNPAASVDNKDSKWKEVGYCGDSSMRCWLDTDSVKHDLQSVEAVEGFSNRVLDENRGMIENGKLNLEAVQAILSSARETIKTLTPDDLKNISKLKVIENLNSVIGVGNLTGAGTNGDRAEALALKASIYRMGVMQAKKFGVTKVVENKVSTIVVKRHIVTKKVPPIKKKNVLVTEKIITELMKKNNNCMCGNNCNEYAGYIKTYSDMYGVNPLRILAVMIQESKCRYNATSGYESYGLMQINGVSFSNICKGELSSGYDSNFNSIKINPFRTEQNVECGIKILAKNYNSYKNGVKQSWAWKTSSPNGGFSSSVRQCVQKYPQYVNYRNWDAALRAYNGWGCGTGADVHYVEKVNKIFNSLKSQENSYSVSA